MSWAGVDLFCVGANRTLRGNDTTGRGAVEGWPKGRGIGAGFLVSWGQAEPFFSSISVQDRVKTRVKHRKSLKLRTNSRYTGEYPHVG